MVFIIQKFAPGRIIIMVTHDEELAYKNATRVVRLHDGKVINDEEVKARNSVSRDATPKQVLYQAELYPESNL